MKRPFAVTGFVCALFFSMSADAQPAAARRATGPIRIDAQLDEPSWQEATPIAIPYEWFPADDAPAQVKTEVLVTWDDHRLYVAFRASDPHPERIRARFAERDGGDEDDSVGFFIDPFNDDRRAYQFLVNPLGVQRDAINSDAEGTEDFSWDGVWDSAGRLTPDGFVVEVAVPLQQLRIPSSGGAQTWGFMAVREWPRDVQHRLRSVTTDQNRDCLICQFGDLAGFQTAASGRNLEVTPTLTAAMQQERADEGFETVDDAIEPGLSARWAMTPGTSLAATINPDFSQVEADSAQLDVNRRFALSYPERRPFFLEGSDFFETQLALMFTRTIADPSAGLKLTGKSGAHAYGVLLARDDLTNFLLPGSESSRRVSSTAKSTTAVGRYRRELSSSASVGGFFSSRTGVDYANNVVSADSYVRMTEQDSLRLQLAGSRTEYPDGIAGHFDQPEGTFDGHAALASYRHSDRNWSWNALYHERSPGFRADSGLIDQVGIRSIDAGFERRIRGSSDRWFRNLYLLFGIDGTREYNGAWNEWGSDIGAVYQGPRQSRIEINIAPNQEYYRGRTYHNFRQSVSAQMQATRDVGVGLFVNWGEQIDFTNARPAKFVLISPSADVNIGRRIRAELAYDWQRLETEHGDRVFDVHLPQARLLYHFSSRAFVRTILQYQSLDLEPAQFVVPVPQRERELLTQVLMSYRINAQTVFLMGYSDNYFGNFDLTQTGRAVFAKVSYAFLF